MRVNAAYSSAVAAGYVPKLEALIEFADGVTPVGVDVDSDDLAVDGSYISDGSESSGIPLWDIVSRKACLKLYNGDGRYNSRDFTGARITIFLRYGSSASARMDLGTFYAIPPEEYGEFITLLAYEDTGDLDAPCEFDDWEKGLQIGLGSLIDEVCMKCSCRSNFTFASSYEDLDNVSVYIPEDSYTKRELLVNLAMILGANIAIDMRNQEMYFSRYHDRTAIDSTITDWIDLSAAHKQTTITGTKVDITRMDSSGRRTIVTDRAGTDTGYVVYVKNNPLMRTNIHVHVLNSGVSGTVFHKMRCSIPFNPMLEFMDHIQITDSHGNSITTYITNVIHYFNGATEIQTSV